MWGATRGDGAALQRRRGCGAWIVFICCCFYYDYFGFTFPAAVFDPEHCNWTNHLISDLVNNIPEEWFGYGLADFALGLVN